VDEVLELRRHPVLLSHRAARRCARPQPPRSASPARRR
jgi:hypothetical protein